MGSLDSPRSPLTAKDPQEHLDRMLLEFPQEILGRVEDRIAGKELAEQVIIVEEMLKRRRETIKAPRYTSPHLRMTERVSDNVFERFNNKQEKQVEVGRGDNGRVFEYESSEGEANAVVFKMLIRIPMGYQNDLLEEGAYQADVAAFAEANKDTQIGVPQPYYLAASSKGYVLAMEKLPGLSVQKILEKNIPIPTEVDLDEIEASLQEFVRRMNQAGFYHRDLREGNIMIDLAREDMNAPVAYVIDFGLCTKAANPEEAYREVDGLRDNVMIKKVLDTVRERLSRQQGALS